MKRINSCLTGLLLCLLAQTATGQLGGLLNRAKEKVTQKLEANKENKPAAPKLYNGNSEAHKKYVNKIKFSNKPIVPGQENESDFKDNFGAGEKIYAVAYLKSGIKTLSPNIKEGDYIAAMVVAPNGQPLFGRGEADSYDFKIQRKVTQAEIDQNITAWAFELIADEKTATSTIPWVFAEMLTSADVTAVSKLSVQMSDWNDGGTFTIDLTGVDRAQLVTAAKEYTANAIAAAVSTQGLPKEWNNYNSKGFDDPALSTANIKKFIKRDFRNCAEVLKVKLIANEGANEWKVTKNEMDLPKSKVSLAVGFVYKSTDGNCYFKECYFVRDYEGGGSYGEISTSFISSFGNKGGQIKCENIK